MLHGSGGSTALTALAANGAGGRSEETATYWLVLERFHVQNTMKKAGRPVEDALSPALIRSTLRANLDTHKCAGPRRSPADGCSREGIPSDFGQPKPIKPSELQPGHLRQPHQPPHPLSSCFNLSISASTMTECIKATLDCITSADAIGLPLIASPSLDAPTSLEANFGS